jgi:hypothetical protein
MCTLSKYTVKLPHQHPLPHTASTQIHSEPYPVVFFPSHCSLPSLCNTVRASSWRDQPKIYKDDFYLWFSFVIFLKVISTQEACATREGGTSFLVGRAAQCSTPPPPPGPFCTEMHRGAGVHCTLPLHNCR